MVVVCVFMLKNIYDVNILPIPMQCETFEHLQVTESISPLKCVTCAVIYHPPHTPMSKFLSEFNDYC